MKGPAQESIGSAGPIQWRLLLPLLIEAPGLALLALPDRGIPRHRCDDRCPNPVASGCRRAAALFQPPLPRVALLQTAQLESLRALAGIQITPRTEVQWCDPLAVDALVLVQGQPVVRGCTGVIAERGCDRQREGDRQGEQAIASST